MYGVPTAPPYISEAVLCFSKCKSLWQLQLIKETLQKKKEMIMQSLSVVLESTGLVLNLI